MIPELFISTHKCSNTRSVQKRRLFPQRQLLRLCQNPASERPPSGTKSSSFKEICSHYRGHCPVYSPVVGVSQSNNNGFQYPPHTNRPAWPQCWHGHFQPSNAGSEGPCGYVWHMNYITEAKIETLYYMTLGHEGRPALKKKPSNTMHLSPLLWC